MTDDYVPFGGPSANLVRRTVARFPGRTAKDLASLSGVSLGHVYVVLSSDCSRGTAKREKGPWDLPVLARRIRYGRMTVDVVSAKIPGVSAADVNRWITAGLLHLDRVGSGYRLSWTDGEVRAAMALDSLRRLGGGGRADGALPADGARERESFPNDSPVRSLRLAVAAAARENEPGTVVDLGERSPNVRMVVVVPWGTS